MASTRDQLVGMYILLFILIFLYPTLNSQIHIIGDHVNATTLETQMMSFTPTIYLVLVMGYAIVCITQTIKMVR